MKKIYTLIILFTLSTSIYSQLTWCGQSYIVVNLNSAGNVWYDGSATAQPSNFNGQTFNSVVSLRIGGELQSFDKSADNATIGWEIKNTAGSGGTIYDSGTLNLPYLEDVINNNKWQQANILSLAEVINASNLLPNTTYYLHIWFYATDTAIPTTVYDSNGGANYVATFTTSGAVPVELTSFTAKQAKAGVMLNWKTATEVNNFGFEIERQILTQVQNDKTKWEKIGFVEGHGNSNSPKEYSFVDNSLNGSVSYRLKQVDFNGNFEYSDIVTVKASLAKTELYQNSPNPFNPSTKISFSLAETGKVNVSIYNIIGQKVAELVNQTMESGVHNVDFNASNLPSGLYIYRMDTPNYSKTMKMMLIK